MNYHTALQRKDGKWDFTTNGHPTGYCREYIPLSEKWLSEAQIKNHEQTAEKHHVHGHQTQEEACECFKEYLLDHRLRFGKMTGQQRECKICKEWTQIYAELDCSLISLCDKHANREFVAQIYNAPTEMWTS